MYQEAIGNTAQDAPSSQTEARVEGKGGRFWVATGSFLEQWNMVMKRNMFIVELCIKKRDMMCCT